MEAQAERNPLQESVANSFDTKAERQAFMDRANPYFMDESGAPRYLPEASQGLGAGLSTISDSLENYFPEAQNYLRQGAGGIGAAIPMPPSRSPQLSFPDTDPKISQGCSTSQMNLCKGSNCDQLV